MVKHKTIKQRILSSINYFSKSEKKVAEYILKNYSTIAILSSSELSKKANVSDTTVIRFTKKMGFNGYYEFKKEIKKEDLTIRSPYMFLEASDQTIPDDTLSNYTQNIVNDINVFAQNLDIETIDNICNSILSANIVYIIGIGSDSSVAHYLKNYLPLLGIICITITEEGLAMKEQALNISNKDFILMSSYPTVQDDEYWIANYVRKQGAELCVISNSEIICQTLEADYSIIANETTTTYYNSCVLTMILSNIILLKLHKKNPSKAEIGLKKYEEIINNDY